MPSLERLFLALQTEQVDSICTELMDLKEVKTKHSRLMISSNTQNFEKLIQKENDSESSQEIYQPAIIQEEQKVKKKSFFSFLSCCKKNDTVSTISKVEKKDEYQI